MADPMHVRYNDGSAYETRMGAWSRLVGARFLDWLAPASGQRWIDVGCGNGALTETIVERCAPASVVGIDLSEPQLAFARSRHSGNVASFHLGDALALPFADDEADIAVSALMIFFAPDPTRMVREMARVVRPGGTIATYAWDLLGGGYPYHHVWLELEALGAPRGGAPHPEAAGIAELRRLWTAAGITGIETEEFVVARRFASFEDYWDIAMTLTDMASVAAEPDAVAAMKARLRAGLPEGPDGSIRPTGRANAVKGRRP